MTDEQICDLWILGAYPGTDALTLMQNHISNNINIYYYSLWSSKDFHHLVLAMPYDDDLCYAICVSESNYNAHATIWELVYKIDDPWCFSPTIEQLMMIFAKHWYQKNYL